jgi:hypothetical protein
MPQYVRDFMIISLISVTITVGIFVVIALPAMLIDRAECESMSRAMQIEEVSWGPLQGCIVRYHGQLIPLDKIGVQTFEEHIP